LAAIVVLICAGIFGDIKNESDKSERNGLFIAGQRMSELYYEINNIPRGAGNDVLFLSKLSDLDALINNPQDTQAKNNLEQDFRNFLKQNQTYKNITLIDSQGTEKLNVYSVSSEIQPPMNHSDKDYFTKTLSLSKNEVYISELEAEPSGNSGNVSVMKYGVPIYNDAAIKPAGVLILTVNPDYFLDDIRNFSRDGEQTLLVDNSGRYLADSDRNKEFSSSGDRYNFLRDYPNVAPEVLKSPDGTGSAENQNLHFIFRYIRPTISSFEIYNGSKNENYYWVLVSIIKKDSQNAAVNNIKMHYLLFILLTLFLVALAATATYLLTFKDKNI